MPQLKTRSHYLPAAMSPARRVLPRVASITILFAETPLLKLSKASCIPSRPAVATASGRERSYIHFGPCLRLKPPKGSRKRLLKLLKIAGAKCHLRLDTFRASPSMTGLEVATNSLCLDLCLDLACCSHFTSSKLDTGTRAPVELGSNVIDGRRGIVVKDLISTEVLDVLEVAEGTSGDDLDPSRLGHLNGVATNR